MAGDVHTDGVDPTIRRDSCLFLFFKPSNSSSSSVESHQDVEIVPIATERRYAEATRELVAQSPALSRGLTASPIALRKEQNSKTLLLNSTSKGDKKLKVPEFVPFSQSNLQSIHSPRESSLPMYSQSRAGHQTQPVAQHSHKDDSLLQSSIEHKKIDYKHAAVYQPRQLDLDYAHIGSQDWYAHQSMYPYDDGFLPASTYDPNEALRAAKKDYSERMGIESPVSTEPPAGNLLGSRRDNDLMPLFKPAEHGLEAMIRAGLYSPGTNEDLEDFYIGHDPVDNHSSQPHFGEVKAQEPAISHRPEFDSVYAQVFDSNPFGIDLSPQGDEDLAMHATLFPSTHHSTLKIEKEPEITRPPTPSGSIDGSIGTSSTEDDVGVMTKDFHSALTSITKEPILPSSRNFGYSAKAMSVLGRTDTQNAREYNQTVISRSKKKPDILQLSVMPKSSHCATSQAAETAGISQKQQLKDMLTALTRSGALGGGKPVKAVKPVKATKTTTNHRSSKVDSLLGINNSPPTVHVQEVKAEEDKHGPRTNSTLFNKLYQQVLKPVGTSRPMSAFSDFDQMGVEIAKHGYSDSRRSIHGQEPVKRATISPINSPYTSLPFPETPVSNLEPRHNWQPKDDRKEFVPSPLKIVKNRSHATGISPFSIGEVHRQNVQKTTVKNDQRSSPGTENPDDEVLKAYHAFKTMDAKDDEASSSKATENRLTFQTMASSSNVLRHSISQKYEGAVDSPEATPKPGLLTQSTGNAFGRTPIHRKPTPQAVRMAVTEAKAQSDAYIKTAIIPPVLFPAGSNNQRVVSSEGSTRSARTATRADQGVTFKRARSPVKKMISNTFDMLGRIMTNSNAFTSASNGVLVHSASSLNISIHAADQNRMYGDLEYIIQDTANRFLLYQHSHGRLSTASVEKVARAWFAKNRPQVATFLYPIGIQRELVELNLDTIIFHGSLAGERHAIPAIMQTWKYVARELAIRSFCLPDAGLLHFLREAARLLELLGIGHGHMMHFQAWSNLVGKTVCSQYQIPYAGEDEEFAGI